MSSFSSKLEQYESENRVAGYSYIDVGPKRVHIWGRGDTAKFAVGHGPIKDIDRQEAERIVGRKL